MPGYKKGLVFIKDEKYKKYLTTEFENAIFY